MKYTWHTAKTIVTEFGFNMDKDKHPNVDIGLDNISFDWTYDNTAEESRCLISIEVSKDTDGYCVSLSYTDDTTECYMIESEDDIDDLIRVIAKVKYFGEHDEKDEAFLKQHKC